MADCLSTTSGMKSNYFEHNRMIFCLFNTGEIEIFVRRRRVFSAKVTKDFYGSND
jgi:hypothetical protein